MITHAELVAAVEEFREANVTDECLTCHSLSAHLNTLAAILNLHDESFIDYANMPPPCGHDHRDWFCTLDHRDWPCSTVGVVAHALRKMGAL